MGMSAAEYAEHLDEEADARAAADEPIGCDDEGFVYNYWKGDDGVQYRIDQFGSVFYRDAATWILETAADGYERIGRGGVAPPRPIREPSPPEWHAEENTLVGAVAGCGTLREGKSTTVLEEAAAIVEGARLKNYGRPKDNHRCTAELMTVYLRRRFERLFEAWIEAQVTMERREEFIPWARKLLDEVCKLDARDVCWLNIVQKASRDANARTRDNLVDTAGYAENADRVTRREYD
jgi:hypothetical protein